MAKIYGQLEKAQMENATSDTASEPKGTMKYRTDTNVATVSDGSATPKILVDTTTAQTLTNKTLTSPVMTTPSMTSPTITSGPITIPEQSTPATPSSGNGKIYFKSDGFLYQLNDDGTESKVGSGGSSTNYILNPDAESNTTGWATYADAAASRPVDGTGGSPALTFTRSTSSPLRGTANFLITKDAANRQGEGASYDFTISAADQAKVLQIGFDYEIGSGTYSGGTSSTDSDLIAYIYRTTATGRLIEPTPIKLDGAVVGQKYQYRGSFQSDSDATGYRLIIHVATTSASAYTVKIDNVSVSPVVYSAGTLITDFVTYTPTLNSNTNVSSNVSYWRRSGDSMEIHGRVAYSGVGNSSQLSLSLPTGYVIDSTKINTTASTGTIGYWGWYDDAGASAGLRNGSVTLLDTSNFTFRIDGGATLINSNQFANNDVFGFVVRVPIVGWGSNVKIANESDTRVVQMAVKVAVPTGGTNGASTTIIGATPDKDTHGGYNLSTGVYTIPVAGEYRINGGIYVGGTAASPNRTLLQIFKNGSVLTNGAIVRHVSSISTDWTVTASTTRSFNAGDTVELRLNTNITSPVYTSGDTSSNYFEVTRVSGPAQIAASEFVGARYGAVSTANLVTDTIIDYATKEYDSHNAVTTGASWKFTAPARGTYQITAQLVTSAAAAGAIGNQYGLKLFKNGSLHAFLTLKTAETTTSCIKSTSGAITLQLNSADTVDLRGINSAGTHALNGDITQNFICITKLDR